MLEYPLSVCHFGKVIFLMRLLPRSVTYKFPDASAFICAGPANSAFEAGPSRKPDVPVPAILLISPVDKVTFRITLA